MSVRSFCVAGLALFNHTLPRPESHPTSPAHLYSASGKERCASSYVTASTHCTQGEKFWIASPSACVITGGITTYTPCVTTTAYTFSKPRSMAAETQDATQVHMSALSSSTDDVRFVDDIKRKSCTRLCIWRIQYHFSHIPNRMVWVDGGVLKRTFSYFYSGASRRRGKSSLKRDMAWN
ncbi:MAG: hypothetical protein Q9196_001508 [Gyalolechia fulgens]